jgi:ubiquinone/menaquinone biosynthesis C-methylase UbiE
MPSISGDLSAQIDWLIFWRQLVEARAGRKQEQDAFAGGDPWQDRADRFQHTVRARWQNPDSSRSFIISRLHSDATLLDIGAGSGAWATLLAGHVQQVTALEASPSMLATLRSTVEQSGKHNIRIVEGDWLEAGVGAHDFSLCAHAMYGAADLQFFVGKMHALTRRTCFMIIRVIPPQGVLAEAARHVLGNMHYRPHFSALYNALLQMGLCPSVLMEDTGLHFPWVSASLEEAVEKMKYHLRVEGETQHDRYLSDLAQRRLVQQGGAYHWPPEVRSALVYWQTGDIPEEKP